ncbi:MAG: response regulator transcription factor [Cyanobacteria bacterium]|nr:response regulator transcription factor [Cyanobacteriota bacterium]
MPKILVVEDDPDYAKAVKDWLEQDGYVVDRAQDAEQALLLLKDFHYDLVILDLVLPDMSGFEVCKTMRTSGKQQPILILTGHRSIGAETGLDVGADDYVRKDTDFREIAARVRALLRRPARIQSNVLQIRDIVLDVSSRQVTKDGEPVDLLPREFSLLEVLLRNRGRVFTVEELMDQVWSSDAELTIAAVRTCINRIRSKLHRDGSTSIIKNIYSVGYVVESD